MALGAWRQFISATYYPATMTAITITQCVCRRMPFAALALLARKHGWTLDDVMRETGCGDQCGLCRPYLRRMLATGETAFHEVLWD
jgi:bacterioferritin-associated ferredoxin